MSTDPQMESQRAEIEARCAELERSATPMPHARARLDLAICLYGMARYLEAKDAFDDVVRRFDGSDELELRFLVSRAETNAGLCLVVLGQVDAGLVAYARTFERYRDAPEPQFALRRAVLLDLGADARKAANRLKECLTASAPFETDFPDDVHPELAEIVVRGLLRRSSVYARLGRRAPAAVVARKAYLRGERATDLPTQRLAATAMRECATCFLALARHEEAIAAGDALLERFGDHPDEQIQRDVVWGFRHRIVSLQWLDRHAEALAAANAQLERLSRITIEGFAEARDDMKIVRQRSVAVLGVPRMEALGDLARWNALDDDDRAATAGAVARLLPPSFRFSYIWTEPQRPPTSHPTAFFTFHNGEGEKRDFILVPGGTFVLGHDRNDPALVSAAMREEWSAHYRPEVTIEGFLDTYTTPLRTVTIEPFLMQHDYFLGYKDSGHLEITGSGTSVDVKRKTITGVLRENGFRLPTSDEWEIACSGGARTLFRWGDDCPFDTDPQATSLFQEHRTLSAFGFDFPSNTYDREMVAETDHVRGGDGGNGICGAPTPLVSWLSLASSYRDPVARRKPVFRGCFRCVLSVPMPKRRAGKRDGLLGRRP